MTIQSMLEWIESTAPSIAIREGGLPYPIIGGVHLLAIALFGGMLLTTDLRLLGWVMRRRPFSDVWHQFRPWKRLGFMVVVATGLLLAWAEPVRLYRSPSFWVKMSLFALIGVHAMVFRARVYGHPENLDDAVSSQAKLAAVLSLILWAGLVVSGRLIAFDASFDR
jgi:L-asparagine transporter-like permease